MDAFVHVFKTALGYHLYDVNTDKVIDIPKSLYMFYKEGIKSEKAEKHIIKLKNEGYLKEKRVKHTKHTMTDLLPFYYQTKINFLVLQLTQNCNLRCEYCVYSGGYNTRTHANERLSFELAKRGMDYLIEHSSEHQRELAVGFYGGEPLLEFELIKKCVSYMENNAVGRETAYSLTTNGTLLTDEVITFFVKNKFNVMISIDGPEEIHDKSRKFAGSDKGSHKVVMKNLEKIQIKYPEYYQEKVFFNTVVDPQKDYIKVTEYISNEPLMNKNIVNFSFISSEFAKEKRKALKGFTETVGYDKFLGLLYRVGRLGYEDVPPLVRNMPDLDNLENYLNKTYRYQLPNYSHRGGPCIPGVRKLFMNVYGKFFPCERVCETMPEVIIGDIDSGVDLKKAEQLLNMERYTISNCRNCWAYNHCGMCPANMEAGDIATILLEKCNGRKNMLEEKLMDYWVLKKIKESLRDAHE